MENLEVKNSLAVSLDITSIIEDNVVPIVFSNGVQTGFTLSDAHIVFKNHNHPAAVVNMSLPAIKSLRDQLTTLIDTYSSNTEQTILSTEEIATIFSRKLNKK